MEKSAVVLGVVFDYTNEGLAALEWASSVFPKLLGESSKEKGKSTKEKGKSIGSSTQENGEPLVRILAVDLVGKETNIDTEKDMEDLTGLVECKVKDQSYIKAVDDCNKKLLKTGVVVLCKGDNIQEIVGRAIQKFHFNMLVLGMEALGSASWHLQLSSKCSVVLVNKNDNPLKMGFQILPSPPANEQATATSSIGSEKKEQSKEKKRPGSDKKKRTEPGKTIRNA